MQRHAVSVTQLETFQSLATTVVYQQQTGWSQLFVLRANVIKCGDQHVFESSFVSLFHLVETKTKVNMVDKFCPIASGNLSTNAKHSLATLDHLM